MRVLQVIGSVDAADGGPVEIAIQLCASLKALGDEPELLVTRPPQSAARERLAGIPVHCPGRGIGRFAYSGATRRWLQENAARFDAVVIHGVWQHCAASAGAACVRHRVPYFVYPHGALDRDLPAMFPVRHVKKKVYWHLVARSLLERAAGVCFTCESEQDRASAFPGRWSSLVIGAGIEAPPPLARETVASLRSRLGASEDGRLVLFIGRLVPLKGVDGLIQSFARARTAAPAAKLVIAGRGTPAYERSLAEIARASRCEGAVVFAGTLHGEAKWCALQAADLFVLPSHRDSFGVAVVEALAAGTPALVTRSVGIAPVIERSGAGKVFDDDEDALAAALGSALSAPVTAAARAAARRCYEENFSARDAAARLMDAMSRGREGAPPTS